MGQTTCSVGRDCANEQDYVLCVYVFISTWLNPVLEDEFPYVYILLSTPANLILASNKAKPHRQQMYGLMSSLNFIMLEWLHIFKFNCAYSLLFNKHKKNVSLHIAVNI